MNPTGQNSKVIDKIIIAFSVLFFATLTNSIFLSQLGYFGALLFLLVKWAVEKKNPFGKTGLELPILLFVITEILSTVFSVAPSQAVHTLVKRFMIIPVLYVTLFVASDEKSAKRVVWIFLGAAFLTAFVYLIASYEHYVRHLYTLKSSGPSTFQYVMTAGGLLSIVTVYFFAFFLNEKLKARNKILLGLAFLILLIALAGSYTRAAWLGTLAGIGIILLIRKNWVVIGLGAGLIIVYFLMNPKVSNIKEYKIAGDKLNYVRTIETRGRARRLAAENEFVLAADYDDGFLVLKNGKIVSHLKTEKPVISLNRYKPQVYYSSTMNKTYYFVSVDDSARMRLLSEFIPPFQVQGTGAVNGLVYFLGSKGEIAAIGNPDNPKVIFTGSLGTDVDHAAVTKNILVVFSGLRKKLSVYSMNGVSLGKPFYSEPADYAQAMLSAKDSVFVFWTGKEFKAFKTAGGKVLKFNGSGKLANTKVVRFQGKNLWALTFDNRLLKVNFNFPDLKLERSYKLPYKANDFLVQGATLYTSYFRVDRISSLLDPYHGTNVQRINQWKTGWRIFKAHPLFGVGDIDLNQIYLQYRAPYETETFGHLHNDYVHVLAILGGVGLVVFLFLLFKIYSVDVRIYSELKNIPFASSFALGTIGAFTAMLVSGLGEWNFGDQEIATMLWFFTGLNIAFFKIYGKGKNAG